ncbi:MAG: hypothetical protein HY392_00470 [Candidatus Diapherotrites archaeon]|nr:hypothetical protein [Candidatus Diapherotrites archaeon]
MKKLLVTVFLLFLVAQVMALSVSLDKNIVKKGESVLFSGSCNQNEPVKVVALRQTLVVFESEFECPPTGEWEIPQEISFLTPSGKWKIFFSQETSIKTVFLTVTPSRESSLFVTDFFNEPPKSANRLDLIVLDLKLLENSVPVTNAEIVFWDLNGQQKKMQESGEGIYRGLLEIPASATLGSFNLFVAAEKIYDTQRKGTEFSTKIAINQAPIVVIAEEPPRFLFEIGKPVDLKIRATYLNKAPLVDGKVVLIMNDTTTELNMQTPELFTTSFIPLEQNSQTKKIKIIAEDKFGNKTEIERNVVFSSGLFVDLYLFALLFLAIAIIGIGFLKVVFPKVRQSTIKLQRPVSEAEIREKIKKLQTEYYNDQKINRKEYQEKMAEFQTKLDELRST